MTAKQAVKEGMCFTGIYTEDSQEATERIAEERKKAKEYGIKVRIVKVREPYGYSAYADSAYREMEKESDRRAKVKYFIDNSLEVRTSLEKSVEEAKKELEKALAKLAEFEKIVGE